MGSEALHCSECGSVSSESVDPPEDAPLVYNCRGCGILSCENCGSGGLCSSCDVNGMAGDDDDPELPLPLVIIKKRALDALLKEVRHLREIVKSNGRLLDGFQRWKRGDLDTEEFEGLFYEMMVHAEPTIAQTK